MNGRELTHDEKKAAEAAFRGLPMDPTWSHAAQLVYDGLIKVLHPGQPVVAGTDALGIDSNISKDEPSPDEPSQESSLQSRLLNRREAIEAGVLIDVSPVAEEVGLHLSVGISKPLWQFGINVSGELSEPECRSRVRDVLIALRLYVEQAEIKAPWIQFPALLAIPPHAEPQLCSLVAVAHRDSTDSHAVTLILPDEMSGFSTV